MTASWVKCALVADGDCPPCSTESMKIALEALRKELHDPVRLRALVSVICEKIEISILESERNTVPVAPSSRAEAHIAVASPGGTDLGVVKTFPSSSAPHLPLPIDASISSRPLSGILLPSPSVLSTSCAPVTPPVSTPGLAQFASAPYYPTPPSTSSVISAQMVGPSMNAPLKKHIPTHPFEGREAPSFPPIYSFKKAPESSKPHPPIPAWKRRAQELHGHDMNKENRKDHSPTVEELTARHLDPSFDPLQYAAEMSRNSGNAKYFDFSLYAKPPQEKKTSIWHKMIAWIY